MKLEINNKLLSDSPFNDSNKDLFIFSHLPTKNIIDDLNYGTETCYLISGYKGAGKSSYVKKIEKKINNTTSFVYKPFIEKFRLLFQKKYRENSKKESENKIKTEIVFVHVNFSRYQNQTILLRKLIRGLFLQIKNLKSYNRLKRKEKNCSINHSITALLEEIYDRTFFEISDTTINQKKSEFNISSYFNLISLFKILLPIAFISLFILNSKNKFIKNTELVNISSFFLSLLLIVQGIMEITFKLSYNNTKQSDFIRKSLYDDEIADFHFFKILEKLKNKNYKIVFVLDELDKVDEEDIDKLFKELKSYLISGSASFIAVGGQNLFYKYIESKLIDDSVLSSIFSKFIHVPLFSRNELKSVFQNLWLNKNVFNTSQKNHINSFIDYLIFESNRVPRKFVSLIRQNLVWENEKSFIDVKFTSEKLDLYTQIMNIIEKITDEQIEAEGFDDCLKDYLVMQLFIKSHLIISSNIHFTRNEILGRA